MSVMSTREFQQVLPTSEARGELSQTLERFRREGLAAAPLIFGSHRRAEGVVIPFELFEAMLPLLEDVLIAETVRERLSNPAPSRPFSELFDEVGLAASDFDLS
jgi:antitoxin StbD